MFVSIQTEKNLYQIDVDHPIDISIPLVFNGAQPNAFDVEPATSKACEAEDMVGDTRQGGSVNFEQYTFIPHCNGTHTECVGHITNERISVRDCLKDVLMSAILVSVTSALGKDGDPVITRDIIATALTLAAFDDECVHGPLALIVRTLPNDDSKSSRRYDEKNTPPYFAKGAMELIAECGFEHLLVDLPSIDRLFDDGNLTNHRTFWEVEQGSFETHSDTRIYSTITELIYVPNEVADGEYLLNLQIAPFMTDASPSRPILFKIN